MLRATRPDRVFHLAGASVVGTSWALRADVLRTNLEATYQLCEGLRRHPVPCLLVSSGEVYGVVPESEQPISEDRRWAPGSPYALSKASQELYAGYYARSEGLPLVIVRAFNHVGPRQGLGFVWSDVARQIAEIERGRGPAVLEVGTTTTQRDFTDVRDMVRAYWLLLARGEPGRTYNAASGKALSIQQVIDGFLARAARRIEVRQVAGARSPHRPPDPGGGREPAPGAHRLGSHDLLPTEPRGRARRLAPSRLTGARGETESMVGHLADLYRYRALIGTLVLRELRARYRGSFLGFLWSFLNPLLLMLVYALVFSIYLRVPMEGYAVFLFSGLLPWLWFSSSLGHAAGVIVASGALVKRILFPAEVLPLVSVLANLINMLLSLPLLFGFLLVFGIRPHAVLLFLPLLLVLQLLLTTGLALALAALNVHLRDVEQILTNGLTLLFFLTPILYPVSTVPTTLHLGETLVVPLRPLYFLNPIAGLVQSYQNIFFFGREPHWIHLGTVTVCAAVALVGGWWVFDRLRDSLAEEI